MDFDAVFVGAGHNALAAAVHLASRGWSVGVFERSDAAGGAVRTAEVRPAPPLTLAGPRLAVRGPAVLELEGSTAWVPDGWTGETDAHGTLVLRRPS